MQEYEATEWVSMTAPFEHQWGVSTGKIWLEKEAERLQEKGLNTRIAMVTRKHGEGSPVSSYGKLLWSEAG